MRIGFYFSNQDGNPLRTGLRRGLEQLGHEVVEKSSDVDLILLFNQTAHTTAYTYSPLPFNKVPLAFIDSAEYGYFTRLPGVAKRYWNAFADGSMEHDTKCYAEQSVLKECLQGRSFPYFIREFHKDIDFPANYHPIDYPLHAGSECLIEPDKKEYLNRELDLFVSWGHSHPWRKHITQALQECPVKKLIQHEHDRLPHKEYLQKMREAKCTVSFDGYGSSSFRLTEALQRCLLLQGPLTMRRYQPLTDEVNCLEWEIESNGEEFIGTNVCDVVRAVADSPGWAYKMYESGYYHCRDNYTEKATAEYVLKTVEQHDWSVETKL